MVCFYRPITNLRTANRELRDNLARSSAGMTTKYLFQKELGPARFRSLGATPAPAPTTYCALTASCRMPSEFEQFAEH